MEADQNIPTGGRVSATSPTHGERTCIDELFDLLDIPAWHADAACKEHPEVTWFPDRGQSARLAKRICRDCLVVSECYAWALGQDRELQGIWAATSQMERRRLNAATRADPPGEATSDRCGTDNGYRRHLNAGEPTCVPCRKAHSEMEWSRRCPSPAAPAATVSRCTGAGPGDVGTRPWSGSADNIGVIGTGVDNPPHPGMVEPPTAGDDAAGTAHRLGGVLPVHPTEAPAAVR